MANLNEAFDTQRSQDNYKYENYMETLKGKIDNNDSTYRKNTINHNFSDLNTAFSRVKVSNEKYDKIIGQHNKSIYGFICKICNGCNGYHVSIQEKFPHEFIRGIYRKLEANETGQFT